MQRRDFLTGALAMAIAPIATIKGEDPKGVDDPPQARTLKEWYDISPEIQNMLSHCRECNKKFWLAETAKTRNATIEWANTVLRKTLSVLTPLPEPVCNYIKKEHISPDYRYWINRHQHQANIIGHLISSSFPMGIVPGNVAYEYLIKNSPIIFSSDPESNNILKNLTVTIDANRRGMWCILADMCNNGGMTIEPKLYSNHIRQQLPETINLRTVDPDKEHLHHIGFPFGITRQGVRILFNIADPRFDPATAPLIVHDDEEFPLEEWQDTLLLQVTSNDE